MATNADAIFPKDQQYPPTGMCSDLLDCVHETYLYDDITCFQGKVMLYGNYCQVIIHKYQHYHTTGMCSDLLDCIHETH